jgi:3',5'-cyclic-AMP phosphodiesterase
MNVVVAPVRPVVVAQFSDLHITRAGTRNRHGIDTAQGLARCIARLHAFETLPDLLIASGDLVDEGTEEEYQRLRDCFAELRIPLCLMPGNHDLRAPLRRVFADHDYLGCEGRIYYYRDVRGLRLIALDSVVEGQNGGELDDAQLAWLDKLLCGDPEQPALVLLHHPPVVTGFSRMDQIAVGSESAARLGQIIARHPQVRAVLCGHVHRDVRTAWQGTLVSVCPSTAFQARLKLGPGAFEASPDESPAYQLHYWDGSSLATHTVTA